MKIYVKRFITRTVPPPQPPVPEPVPRLPIIGSADFGKSDVSYIDINKPYANYLDLSIHSSRSSPRFMDRRTVKESISENIEYGILRERIPADELDELVELMTDTLCTTRLTVKIGGENIPVQTVQDRRKNLQHTSLPADGAVQCPHNDQSLLSGRGTA